MLKLNCLDSRAAGFEQEFAALLARDPAADQAVQRAVQDILADVQSRGDDAVLEYARRFDRSRAATMRELEIPKARLHTALAGISAELRSALETAAARIRVYAEKQKLESWSFTDEHGNVLGQQITPLERVGIYVPGGKAAYPSSVLMNTIPAKVAGVGEIIMVTPSPEEDMNEVVLAAAAIAGVDRAFRLGGAHAIAALAYGTATVPAVDKIVGPGNAYVAAAKRAVFGVVGIDMIAGPSEILVICDGDTNPDWIALDLFSQAEHDEDAQAILLSPDARFLEKVAGSIQRLLQEQPRAAIIEESLRARGALIQVRDLNEAANIANRLAPEHLELSVAEPQALLKKIRHAGAIFLGRYTPEAFGDYCAGPNHVLPTARSARFSSPLGVYDFQKRSSVIQASERGAPALARTAATLAEAEGLVAHQRSAEYRK
ncbi:MAG: histidinol dehydrogenase [Nevskiales bacterium]